MPSLGYACLLELGIANEIGRFALFLKNNYISIYSKTELLVSRLPYDLNMWNHVRVSRKNGTLTIYLNGVAGGSLNTNTEFSVKQARIGNNYGPNFQFTGYLSGFKFTLP